MKKIFAIAFATLMLSHEVKADEAVTYSTYFRLTVQVGENIQTLSFRKSEDAIMPSSFNGAWQCWSSPITLNDDGSLIKAGIICASTQTSVAVYAACWAHKPDNDVEQARISTHDEKINMATPVILRAECLTETRESPVPKGFIRS